MEQFVYFIECGRKRKGEEVNCKKCGKKFIRRIKAQRVLEKKIYCSIACKAVARQVRIPVQCANCNKTFARTPKAIKQPRHGLHFCSRKCKDFAQSLDGNCNAIRPAHYGTAKDAHSATYYRRKMRDELKRGCKCGEKNAYLLVVHHIDGNRMNNKKVNLEVVCHNCHAKRHLKKINDKWAFSYYYLTPRDLLVTL